MLSYDRINWLGNKQWIWYIVRSMSHSPPHPDYWSCDVRPTSPEKVIYGIGQLHSMEDHDPKGMWIEIGRNRETFQFNSLFQGSGNRPVYPLDLIGLGVLPVQQIRETRPSDPLNRISNIGNKGLPIAPKSTSPCLFDPCLRSLTAKISSHGEPVCTVLCECEPVFLVVFFWGTKEATTDCSPHRFTTRIQVATILS